jgi:ABC-type transport system substrate-binding protein
MKRRRLVGAAAASAVVAGLPVGARAQTVPNTASPSSAGGGSAPAAAARKVLRIAFNAAETSFDPSQIQDTYSRSVTPHIFEAPYCYDYLARPTKTRPLTAAAMPEHADDFKTWTVRLRPGIFFASDPAFKGVRRELVAQDYIYSMMRVADPANKSPLWGWLETFSIIGLAEYRQEVTAAKSRFDYDRVIPGVRALDRHTLRFTLSATKPRFLDLLTASDLLGAQAREVVEFYGDKIAEHPVGTGPYRLKQWRRSSRVVLERNPEFREMFWEAEPAADDAEGQAIAAQLKGRRLPMIDEVQISIIDEDQPRWLSFLNEELDMLGGKTGALPGNYVAQAMPLGKMSPAMAKRGIKARQQVNPEVVIYFFNMDDPTVGGYTPDKVALRRAISLGMDTAREIRILRRGQGIPVQSMVVPHTFGYDPKFKSEASDYDPGRAKALLDIFGFQDRDGDGYRELPDGKPLTIEYHSQSEVFFRELTSLFVKNMRAIGVRVNVNVGLWPDQAKQARAGKLMMWGLASSATSPDGQGTFQRLHGPQAGGQNFARFKLPAFDALYDRLSALPDGPERLQLMDEAKRLAIAYMPYKTTVHRISTDIWHPWVIGFRRPHFHNEWYHMLDIDTARKPAAS